MHSTRPALNLHLTPTRFRVESVSLPCFAYSPTMSDFRSRADVGNNLYQNHINIRLAIKWE